MPNAAMMEIYRDEEIEAGSGKGAGDENFPVASRLVARELRPHVMAYYAFARAADDIADSPTLPADDKRFRLNAFRDVLEGRAQGLSKAEALRKSLEQTGVPLARASDLITAFLQDADKSRYQSLPELLDYCRHSADPVGRFLLDLHGEDSALYPASDALCTSLQILNHLQDLGKDRALLDRVYLPLDWLAAERESVEALDRASTSPALRRVIDRALDTCDALLAATAPLLAGLRTRSLKGESAAIIHLARRLSHRLRRGDPLAQRIDPTRADFAAALALGAAAALRKPAGPLPMVPRSA
ncbi:squalene synthase HpnC [Thermaurantiacus sp.]